MSFSEKSFFLLGIKGAAMANIAVMLAQMGKHVTGVDVDEVFITDKALTDASITYSTDFTDSAPVDACEVFVYSAAHGGLNHPLARRAQAHGKRCVSQSELLGSILASFRKSIAVSGCHGKTTTSSLLAWALRELKVNPSYMIGAPPHAGGGGGTWTQSDYMVIEADEYGVQPPADKRPKLLFLNPSYSICTNIDFDHSDVYDTIEDTKKTFIQFFNQSNHVLACGDDVHIQSILPHLDRAKVTLYGTAENNDYRVHIIKVNEQGSRFEIEDTKKKVGLFETKLFGEKNMLNAAAVVVCLIEHGFAVKDIQNAIAGFSGAKRRQELIWSDGNSFLFDDYGHHPAEIRATIDALRTRFPDKELYVIFQPHTFSRTEQLLEGFAKELASADHTFILPIFPSAREDSSRFTVRSEAIEHLARKNGHTNITVHSTPKILIDALAQIWKKGSVVLTLGAGDVYKLKDEIMTVLTSVELSVKKDVDLFRFLTMRLHVKADFFCSVTTEDELVAAYLFAQAQSMPFTLLGGGSNLVFGKSRIPGLVVQNTTFSFTVEHETDTECMIRMSSGTPMAIAVQKTVEMGLSGFEYHKGLPGTVGGAVAMNSKWTKPLDFIGDHLISARILTKEGEVKDVDASYFAFAYDYSILQDTHEVLLSAVFRFRKSTAETTTQRASEALAYRAQTQPAGVATCGCFFQNISDEEQKKAQLPTKSAGYLIDRCGLKGYEVGGFRISAVHANFIENSAKGNSRPEDLKTLIDTVKSKVQAKYGILLREEVKITH